MIVKYKPIEISAQSLWVCCLNSLTLVGALNDIEYEATN